ncbi:hypothetical protein T492DRAFT_899314 [Pavlovales sp. CCMP2436]|nr:hypothetical protein T492DRAFT_899314 [Pavlovales sp. CCMP2436]
MCVPAEQEKIVGVVPAEKASCAPVRPAGAEKLLWRLHGAEYDFEPFVKSHPGGEIAIRLGQGIDATLLFASYHAVGKGRAWATLECFRVGAKLPEPPAPSPFRDDVEKMLESHFNSAEPRRVSKASASHIALMALFGVLQLVGWVAWARGELLGLLLLPVFHWLFAVNVSHDATHFACSKSPLLNSLLSYTSLPYFYSPVTWYAQHVVMHHTHANEVNSDPDLQHFQPMKIHTLDTRVHKNETHTLLDYVKLLGTGLHLSLQIPVAASGVTTASYAKWYLPISLIAILYL